jgi:hypothetical protein
MAITAISGPFVAFGITQTSTGGMIESNVERGPSLFDIGIGTADPRPAFTYKPGSGVGTDTYGFYSDRALVDFVPFALSSNLIATSSAQIPTGNVITIYTSRAAAGLIQTTIIAPETGQNVSVFAIDSTAQTLIFGSTTNTGTIAIWNPTAGSGRGIAVTSPTCGISNVTIAGRDMYGFKVTETASATSSDANNIFWTFRKTYKYISAMTYSTVGAPAGTTSTGVGAGSIDLYGFPLLLKYTGIDTYYNVVGTASAAVINSTGPVTLGATATATSTTGDVRGTYSSTTASNGTIRIQLSQRINAASAWQIGSSDVSAFPLFGVTQFSSV